MKNKICGIALCLFGIGIGMAIDDMQLEARDADDYLRPKVVRTQDDGRVYYQHIILKNTGFQFSETEKMLTCYSDLFDYDISKDKDNHLTNFRLYLKADSKDLYRSMPGRGSLIPLLNSTSYQDLNGDSVLDTMSKSGPQGSSTSILYKNTWLEVYGDKRGLAVGRSAFSIHTKTTYVFKGSGWEVMK